MEQNVTAIIDNKYQLDFASKIIHYLEYNIITHNNIHYKIRKDRNDEFDLFLLRLLKNILNEKTSCNTIINILQNEKNIVTYEFENDIFNQVFDILRDFKYL
jgi:hypothetical protein